MYAPCQMKLIRQKYAQCLCSEPVINYLALLESINHK